MEDNAGLYYALSKNKNVQPLFIFDTSILNKLENKTDKRVDFIHKAIAKLHKELNELGLNLWVEIGEPLEVFKRLLNKNGINSVYTNHDYEPSAIVRDQGVEDFLKTKKITFHSYKDQCIFEKNEVLKDDGKPYTIFTPYSKS